MGLDHPAPLHGRRRSTRPEIAALAALAIAASASAQTCDNFPPWTIAATPKGGQTVRISICGKYVGCTPHDPTATVAGSSIQLTLLGNTAPPGQCQCITAQGTFEESVIVFLPAAGEYSVHASFNNCSVSTDVGSTSFVFGGAATVPALDPRGMAAMVVLMAAAAAWRLRR